MDDCIFCRIINRQIPAELVDEQAGFIVIKDIAPKAPLHLLIIAKKHLPSLQTAAASDAELLGQMLLRAKKIAAGHGLGERGYRLVINTGPEGGQEVPHLHIHFLGGGRINTLA